MAKTPASSPETHPQNGGDTHQTASTPETRITGCAELMKEGAAIDFSKDAFGHLKAIGFTPEAQPLLNKAGGKADAGVVDVSTDAKAWLKPAATRQWDREPKVRLLA